MSRRYYMSHPDPHVSDDRRPDDEAENPCLECGIERPGVVEDDAEYAERLCLDCAETYERIERERERTDQLHVEPPDRDR